MWLSSWLRNPSPTCTPQGRGRRRPAAPRFRPHLEALEGRAVPSATVLKVTSLADSGHGTLRDAILTADQHTNKTYEIDILVAGTILLESSLPDLANTITIKGLGTGQTLLQRDTLAAPFRILTVDAGRTAVLSGLGITNGDAGGGSGGAIDNFGNLTLDGCALSGNRAASGGAVENEAGASLTATSTNFSSNQAGTYTGTTASYGGGVDNNGTLTVRGGFFSGNSATDGGGINNTGALAVGGGCTFDGNSATNQTLADFGGGINNNGMGTAQVADCTFNNNESDNHGAGMYNAAGHSLTVSNCHFTGNHVVFGNGGSIENAGTLAVDGSTFLGNTVSSTLGYSGGAISNVGTATVSRTAFGDGTSARSNSATYGGAIINWSGATLTLNAGTSFSANVAAAFGGAIYNVAGGTLVAGGTAFTNNAATYGGAVITFGAATFDGCTFTSNHATTNDGGAIWNSGALTVRGNSNFLGNTAIGYGGAIMNVATAAVTQSAFGGANATDGNSASTGGAIENWFGARLTVNPGSSFTNNSATVGGGAINNNGRMDASGASFTSNTAGSGGGIATDGVANLDASTFTANHSTGAGDSGGGAIWNNGTLAVQDNSSFFDNTAHASGGAVLNLATATVTQTMFDHNSAADGGAIENMLGADLTTSSNTRFLDNHAGIGGAIENINGGTVVASGASFVHNSAGLGGAIWSEGALAINGSSFSENTAGEAGAIYNSSGVANVTQTSFTSNSAQDGGAIIDRGGVLTVMSCELTFNTASNSAGGGGIFTYLGGQTTIDSSILLYNSPDDTHTVADGSTLTVTNSIIGNPT